MSCACVSVLLRPQWRDRRINISPLMLEATFHSLRARRFPPGTRARARHRVSLFQADKSIGSRVCSRTVCSRAIKFPGVARYHALPRVPEDSHFPERTRQCFFYSNLLTSKLSKFPRVYVFFDFTFVSRLLRILKELSSMHLSLYPYPSCPTSIYNNRRANEFKSQSRRNREGGVTRKRGR